MDFTISGLRSMKDRLLEFGAHGVDGFEGIVFEDFLADFVPQIFLRVELWRVGRQEEQRDIVGKHEVAADGWGHRRAPIGYPARQIFAPRD